MQQENQELQRINQELSHLNQVLQTVNSTLDLDKVIYSVTEALQTIFSFDQIGIFLVDNEKQELNPSKYYGKGVTKEVFNRFKELHLPLEEKTSYVCDVIIKNRFYYISSVTTELSEHFSPLDKEIFELNPVKAYLLYPLQVLNHTIGVIVFAHTQKAFSLSDKDIERIQHYVAQVAASIQNAKLYEQSQKAHQEIQDKNELLEGLSNKLSRYLSPQVYNSIFSGQQDVKLWSSRKKLTIFFSDIMDFTELTDYMESEAITALLNDYLNEMSRIALRYGGTIDKFIGDAIMIFFGDPETRGEKEDALACVLMAIEMRNHMKYLQKKWEKDGIIKPLRIWKGMTPQDKKNEEERILKPLQIRIGINTGYCTVGNFGSEDRLDYTIIGGQVNLANRLESNAEPDQILISHETHALIKDKVYCEKKNIIKVKGIAYPVQTYHVFDLHENVTIEKDVLIQDGHGYSISINFNEIPESDKSTIIESLNQAISKLKHSIRHQPFISGDTQTRQDIINAALQLCAEEGYAGLTLRSVARKAGVAPTSFYRYFREIDELGLAMVTQAKGVLDEWLEQVQKQITFPAVDKSDSHLYLLKSIEFIVIPFVETFMEFLEKNNHLLRLFFQERTGSSKTLRSVIEEEMDRITMFLSEELKRFSHESKSGLGDVRLIAESMLIIVSCSGMEMIVRPELEHSEISKRAIKKINLLLLGQCIQEKIKQGKVYE